MKDCKDCLYNTYGGVPNLKDWFACGHPTTLAKTPKPEPGDPHWINLMTADMRASFFRSNVGTEDCPAWKGKS